MALPYGYSAASAYPAAGFPTAGFPYGYSAAPFGYQPAAYSSPYLYRGGYSTIPSTYGFGASSPYQFSAVPTAAQAADKSSGIKITYFDITGKAEPLRLALYVAGVPFEDERLTKEDWEENHKSKAPFGKLPLLTVGDKVLAQSIAQLMFIGSMTGLYSDDMWERAKINEALFLGEDIIQLMISVRHAKEDQVAKKTAEAQEKMPVLLGYVEKLLTETNTGYLAGARLTIADLNVWVVLSLFDTLLTGVFPATLFDKFPRVTEFRARVAALPRVAEWNNLQEQKKKEKEAAAKAKEEESKKATEETKEEEKPAEQQ